MKDKVCRCKEEEEEGCCSCADNKTTHQKSSTIYEDNLYRNRRQDEKDDENDTRLNDRNQTERNSTHKGCVIEYLLICTTYEEQTGYGCPLFALQYAWEHIPMTQHNLVTILEILYDRGLIYNNKRVDTELIK